MNEDDTFRVLTRIPFADMMTQIQESDGEFVEFTSKHGFYYLHPSKTIECLKSGGWKAREYSREHTRVHLVDYPDIGEEWEEFFELCKYYKTNYE